MGSPGPVAGRDVIDSAVAWWRLAASVALMVIGACGMYVVVVVLPLVQAEFESDRGGASLPYTATMIGFGVGTVLMGRIADRWGIMVSVIVGACGIASGFALAGLATNLTQYAIAHGVLIGMMGSSATFAPLIADASLWFDRRRGIAVAICAAGNYIGGGLWPPIVQACVEQWGWRATYFGIAAFCLVTMLPLALRLRLRPPSQSPGVASAPSVAAVPSAVSAAAGGKSATALYRSGPWPVNQPLGMSTNALLSLLCVAGVACCVAMSMPQVHIVAYCTDLGYGAARGAQMLSLMLAFGIVSRLVSGVICDRIGGLRTLLLGSVLQTVALVLFLPFDSLASLFVVSILFGLFQGGIVPSYAIVVRELLPPGASATRVGLVITSTLLGMALGGWMSGAIFDWTGSYHAAFVNGVAWNLFNVGIVVFLLMRTGSFVLRSRAVDRAYPQHRMGAGGAGGTLNP